jgi:hypothetical protein
MTTLQKPIGSGFGASSSGWHPLSQERQFCIKRAIIEGG